MTIDLMENGNMTTFSASAPSQSLSVQGSFDMQKVTAEAIQYALSIFITHPSLMLNIGGNVDIQKSDAVTIEAPASSQTLEELLGGFGSLLDPGTQAGGT